MPPCQSRHFAPKLAANSKPRPCRLRKLFVDGETAMTDLTRRRFAKTALAGLACLGLMAGASLAEENSAQTEAPGLARQLDTSNPGIAYLESLKGSDRFLAPSQVDWRYETVIYVNLATSGKTAQRMWVLHRDHDQDSASAQNSANSNTGDAIQTLIATAGDSLPEHDQSAQPTAAPWRIGMWDKAFWDKRGEVPTYSWLISSGRKYPGDKFSGPTPTGVFNLDERRGRQKLGYYSAGMYDAMFIDLHYSSGRRSGVALHGTTSSKYRLLGRADSHGCIRMHRRNSRALFDRVLGRDGVMSEQQIKGEVPRFFRTSPSASVRLGYNRQGELIYSDEGDLLTKDGFRTLIVMFKDHKGSLPKLPL